MNEARRILGVDKGASKAEIRRAWRQVARRLHPDVNPSPGATDEFKIALAAYRSLMGRSVARKTRPVERACAPSPFVCPDCEDQFTQMASCPRCGVALHARADGPTPCASTRQDVDAMIAALESPVTPSMFEIHPALRMPLMALLLMVVGIGQANIGLWPLAMMSLGFGVLALLMEAQSRMSPEWLTGFDERD